MTLYKLNIAGVVKLYNYAIKAYSYGLFKSAIQLLKKNQIK